MSGNEPGGSGGAREKKQEEKLEQFIEHALQHRDGPREDGGKGQHQVLRPEDIHVLVVDDERLSRTVVSTLLKKCKYTVTTAEDGAEAMELLQSHAPGTFHLVLTDVCMPQMNGIELLQYVRSDDALRSVPVVMMSSIDNGDTVYECVEGGAEEYLVKPVTQKEVQHIWQHVLRKRSAVTTVPQATCERTVVHDKLVSPDGHGGQMSRSASVASGIGLTSSGKEAPGDLAVAGDFLKLMRDTRMNEAAKLKFQLEAIEQDSELVLRVMLGSKRSGTDSEDLNNSDAAEQCKKRCRKEIGCLDVSGNKRSILDDMYFSNIHRKGDDATGQLEKFADDLHTLSHCNKMSVKSVIRSGTMASPQEMVCCSDFDAEDSHFATVSVSRSVKVFDFNEIQAMPESLQFPVWQATTRSKLSSVSWNAYIRSHLITSDYDGLIQLWDVSTGAKTEISQFEAHAKRVWSVDFSRLDPMQFASASDDATVKLWNINHEDPVACLRVPANACSVQYSPQSAMLLAVACANHNSYIFDVRKPDIPLASLTGSQRAVSYVRFLDGNTVVGASTDSMIRTWNISNLNQMQAEPNAITSPRHIPSQHKYIGHVNDRNFVGLSVHQEGGLIATGSEDNTVKCYYKSFPFPVAQHNLSVKCESKSQEADKGSLRTFVSSVSWARHSKQILVGNSDGVLKILQMK